jgi:hypothetical protein
MKRLPDSDPRVKRIGRIMEEIEIKSRHDDEDERYLIAVALSMIPWQLRQPITRVFCDSKASFSFAVDLSHWDPKQAEQIGYLFADGVTLENGGHNGVVVQCGGLAVHAREIHIPGRWER